MYFSLLSKEGGANVLILLQESPLHDDVKHNIYVDAWSINDQNITINVYIVCMKMK